MMSGVILVQSLFSTITLCQIDPINDNSCNVCFSQTCCLSLVWAVSQVLTGPRQVISGETVEVITLSKITLEVCGRLSWSLGRELVSLM